VVFETPWQLTLVHIGSLKYLKCPACGKSSMMHTNVKDPVIWSPEAGAIETHKAISEEDQLKKRIEDSRYEH
jgi:hypothetical protein